MPVMLRNSDDYYVTIETIDGSKFWLRDLSDDDYDAFLTAAAEGRALIGLDAAGLLEALERPEKMIELQVKTAADPEKLRAMRVHQRDLVHLILRGGLVRWDLPFEDGERPNGALLPSPVKVRLARRIIEISDLRTDEENFHGGVGAGASRGQ